MVRDWQASRHELEMAFEALTGTTPVHRVDASAADPGEKAVCRTE
ncbi:MAG: hypothetical protein PVJ28_06970 [Acidimicrobiia bacterium]|jgi:hypothetical protein